MRTFLIPMQEPSNGTGKGTRFDPWKPKYLTELNLDFSIANARNFCFAEVMGSEEMLNELAQKVDVVELKNSGKPLSNEKHKQAFEMLQFIGVRYENKPITKNSIEKIKLSVLNFQKTSKPSKSLHLSVMQNRFARGN